LIASYSTHGVAIKEVGRFFLYEEEQAISRIKGEKQIRMGRKSLDNSKVCSVRRLVEHKTLVAIFLFFICLGLYAPSLRNGFVWDDVLYIKHKPYLFRPSNVNSGTFLSIKEKREFSHYRPMSFISLVVDHELWGRSRFGFHLSTVIFYSISTVLFYLLSLFVLEAFRVDGKETKAFLSSLLFDFYPAHVESVSWVAGKMDFSAVYFSFQLLYFIYFLTEDLVFWR
jgi:hypothetical protein